MMNKNERIEKFTPGPWKVGISANSRFDMMNYYVFAERKPDPKHPFAPELFICRTDSTVVERDADEKQGNAALIAAAPEMYEMLDFLLEFVKNGGNEGEIRECYASAIHALLKKARGEA